MTSFFLSRIHYFKDRRSNYDLFLKVKINILKSDSNKNRLPVIPSAGTASSAASTAGATAMSGSKN
jgi:hypothetical protein